MDASTTTFKGQEFGKFFHQVFGEIEDEKKKSSEIS